MPLRVPNLLTGMGHCQWYVIAKSIVVELKTNALGLKLINARMKKKVVARDQGK